MQSPDEMMHAYIQKVLRLQQEQKQRPPDDEELARIVEELGLTPEDRAFIDKKLKDYIARGQGYSRYEDWDSAIEEFEQALALSPNNVDVLYGLGNAYRQRWQLKKAKNDLIQAKHYAKRAVQVNAQHEPSLRLVSELNRGILTKTNPFAGSNTGADYNKPDWGWTDSKSPVQLLFDIKASLNQEWSKYTPPEAGKKLKKSQRDKKIFGVCGGIGEYFGIDSTWIRIFFILGVFLGGGLAIPLYIVLAFILPKY